MLHTTLLNLTGGDLIILYALCMGVGVLVSAMFAGIFALIRTVFF